jgi:hypothetical protein
MLNEDGTMMWDGNKGDWVSTGINPIPTQKIVSDDSNKLTSKRTFKLNSPLSGVILLVLFGFMMLNLSSMYSYSANYSTPPLAPSSDDFDTNFSGGVLEENERIAYENAVDIYEDQLREYNTERTENQGKSVLWGQIGPVFICMGLVVLCLGDFSEMMPKSVRIILIIFTFFFMLQQLLGYNDGLGADLDLGLGVGGNVSS